MTDDITCDVCTASSDWVCRRCYDAMSREENATHERALAAELRARGRTDASDAEEYALRRVLTGALNDAISAQKAKANDADNKAEEMLALEADKLERQSGWLPKFKVSTHVTSQPRLGGGWG